MSIAEQTIEVAAPETFIVIRAKSSLRNNSIGIIQVWVRRFVEQGENVRLEWREDFGEIAFHCPDWRAEMEVERLCEIINKFGFAKPLWTEAP